MRQGIYENAPAEEQAQKEIEQVTDGGKKLLRGILGVVAVTLVWLAFDIGAGSFKLEDLFGLAAELLLLVWLYWAEKVHSSPPRSWLFK